LCDSIAEQHIEPAISDSDSSTLTVSRINRTYQILQACELDRKLYRIDRKDCLEGVDDHAKQMLHVWSDIVVNSAKKTDKSWPPQHKKLRLANVSPLPPQRSGIADYSRDLLPFLADFYEIDVVVDQSS